MGHDLGWHLEKILCCATLDTIVVDPETRMSPEHLWDKVDNNFTCEMAQCEAGRCLQCDLRVPIRKVENFNAYSKR